MDTPAVVCPKCGVRYDLPAQRQPADGTVSTGGPGNGDGRVLSVSVDDVVVHQCRYEVDPVTGAGAWRPARTVGGRVGEATA